MAHDLDLSGRQPGLDAAGRTPAQVNRLRDEARHQAAVARLVAELRDPKRPTRSLGKSFQRGRKSR